MLRLRMLLRQSCAVAMVAVHSAAMDKRSLLSVRHLSDAIITLGDFSVSAQRPSAPYSDFHGIIKVTKPFVLNTLALPAGLPTADMAYKLRRKAFAVETVHLVRLPNRIQHTQLTRIATSSLLVTRRPMSGRQCIGHCARPNPAPRIHSSFEVPPPPTQVLQNSREMAVESADGMACTVLRASPATRVVSRRETRSTSGRMRLEMRRSGQPSELASCRR
jgi:hypothetical protein